jgi:hypothetical protein
MDSHMPSSLGPDRTVQRDAFAESKVGLLIAYFESSRQELVSRLIQRDNTLLLFLAAVAAIFGVAFGNVTRPEILFAIAPLGVGLPFCLRNTMTLLAELHIIVVWNSLRS